MLKSIPPASIESIDSVKHIFWERGKRWKHLCDLLEHGNPELWVDMVDASHYGIDAYGQKSVLEFFQKWYGIIHYNVVEKGKEDGATYRVPALRFQTIENFRMILEEMANRELYPSKDIFDVRKEKELGKKRERLKIDHLNGFVRDELEWLARMKHVIRIEDIRQLERSYRFQLNIQAAYDRLEGLIHKEVPYTSVLLDSARHHEFRQGVELVEALTKGQTSLDLAIKEKVFALFQQPAVHTPQRAYLLDPRLRPGQ
jgi:hypothetical protein